jgi:hypothetical protein
MANTVKMMLGMKTGAQKTSEAAQAAMAASAERRQLADVARQNASADGANAGSGRKRGSKVLTFLGSGGMAGI